MNHANYEVVRVEDDRVFISDVSGPSIYEDRHFVFIEIEKNFPNRRLIFKSISLSSKKSKWLELIKNKIFDSNLSKYKYWDLHFDDVQSKEYNEHFPKDSEITGMPSSVFFRKENKQINKINKFDKKDLEKLIKNNNKKWYGYNYE